MSLKSGLKKMSKSDPSENSRINMTDGSDDIQKKIKKATSDAELLPGRPEELIGRPEASNLLGIFAALSDKTLESVCQEFEGKPFSVFKSALVDIAIAVLAPIGDEMARLLKNPEYLNSVLKDGSNRANDIASPILKDVYEAVGFLRT